MPLLVRLHVPRSCKVIRCQGFNIINCVFCHKRPDEARGFPLTEFRCCETKSTPMTIIRQPTNVLKKRAPGCLVCTKPYTPLEVTSTRSVSPSFEKSSHTKACVGGAGRSTVVRILPPGDNTMASWSPAARIISWLSWTRKGNAFNVGTTLPPSVIPDGDGRFDHVAPVKICQFQIASWPCKPGEYDVTWNIYSTRTIPQSRNLDPEQKNLTCSRHYELGKSPVVCHIYHV